MPLYVVCSTFVGYFIWYNKLDMTTCAGRVLDVSEQGLCIEASDELASGAVVSLKYDE